MFGWKEMNCIVCGENSETFLLGDGWHRIYICPTCGLYIYYDGMDVYSWLDSSEQKEYINFPSYLYYHHIDREIHVKKERNYIGDEKALKFHLETEQDSSKNIKYNLVTDNVVREFIPKTLQEKERMLLKDIYNKRDKVSDITEYTINEIESAAFVIRQESFADNYIQYRKLLFDLKDDNYIEIFNDGHTQQFVKVRITTKGIKHIEEGDKQMEEKSGNVFINTGTYVNSSSVVNSTIGNGISSTNFDYDGLRAILKQISESLQKVDIESKQTIVENIEEANEYIETKDQKHLFSRLNTISTLIQTCGAIPAVIELGKMIQPYITQISNLLGA